MPVLGEGFSGPVHVVFGNNDGDRFRFDDIGRALAGNPAFGLVCFGHSHRYAVERVGNTWSVNPGEVHGGLSGQSTMVLYDTGDHAVLRVDL